MTYLVERLAQLRKHLDHLRDLRPRVSSPRDLESDLSLHNDVLFSLLTVAQLVIDIAGELSARRGLPFEDYTTAVMNLSRLEGFSEEMVEELVPLPGFRNVLIREYVGLDYEYVVRALNRLEPIEEFIRIVGARLEDE
ncbi:MAG: HepT-like ribonuclease domain-containing protein [Longimicrobiales bacterium]|nr:HepT-like ribonuclease domain-containing protein [Longimicrobiales bacterium]